MKALNKSVKAVSLFQLGILAWWIAILAGGNPKFGTVLNLGIFGLAAVLAISAQANGRFRTGAIILNFLEAAFWSLGLVMAITNMAQVEPEARAALQMVFMTLGIVIPSFTNGILCILLPSQARLRANKSLDGIQDPPPSPKDLSPSV